MSSDPVSRLLHALREVQLSARRSVVDAPALADVMLIRQPAAAPAAVSGLTIVEYRSDPAHDFTQVTIYGPTAQAVSIEIDRAMRAVERDGGSAVFKGPKRALSGYGAIGEIVRQETAEAAE